MSDDQDRPVPTRRVTFEVTAYWRHGVVQAGWFDMQTEPDGGEYFSIPHGCVDESTVRDAPPERLTRDDWDEIRGVLTARLGNETGAHMVARWQAIAAEQAAEDAGAS